MKSLNDIGILAMVTRMKRLYDTFQKQVKTAYTLYDLDFDPKWFTVVFALIENERMSVGALSQILGLSHPSIIQIVKELEKRDWVISAASPTDKRVRLLALSDMAKAKVPELQRVWSDMRLAVQQINHEGQVDFWEAMLEVEASLSKKSFQDRVAEIKRKQKKHIAMVRLPEPWFSRKFHFQHLSTNPEILFERLGATTLRLTDIVKGLSEDQLIHSEDKWSIKQHIGHLIDLEPLWYQRVVDILEGKEVVKAADLSNKKTSEANHNYLAVDSLIANFSAQRQLFVRICHENLGVLESRAAMHPRLKTPMRIIDLMYFAAEHDDHHIATMRYLIDQF